MAYTELVRLLQIWLAWSLAFFFCIAAPAQAMSASKALANPLATKLDTHYFPINNTDPDGLQPVWLRGPVLFSKPSIIRVIPRVPSQTWENVGKLGKSSETVVPKGPPSKTFDIFDNLIPEDFKLQPGGRGRFQDGAKVEEQFDGVKSTQKLARKQARQFKRGEIDSLEEGKGKIVDQTGKSEMREQNTLKRIRTQSDADYDYYNWNLYHLRHDEG